MAASCFSTSPTATRRSLSAPGALQQRLELGAPRRRPLGRPAVFALALVAAAVLLAPERPWVEGETCLRHQSPAACQVW